MKKSFLALVGSLYLCLVFHDCAVGGVSFTRQNTYILSAKFATVEGILTVSQKLVDEGYVIFPSTDGVRTLAAVCDSRDMQFVVEERSPKEGTGEPRFFVKVEMGLTRPEYAGGLTVCASPEDMFRKPDQTEASCLDTAKPTVIAPEVEVTESVTLGVYTLFMSKEQYKDLRDYGTTEVFIPLFDEPYSLPLYFVVYYPWYWYKCTLEMPGKDELLHFSEKTKEHRLNLWYGHTARHAVYLNNVTLEDSGEYKFRCHGDTLYRPARSLFKTEVEKTLKLTFIRGPKIQISGQQGNKVLFSAEVTSGAFVVDVYTASPVKAFLVKRSDGKPQEQQLLVEFLSYPYYNIHAKYRVGIPWITAGVNGLYAITVTNQNKESATKIVQILKAESLSLEVSPKQQITSEGEATSFECLVSGYPLTTITWARDFRELRPDEDSVEVISLSEGRSGLRLTFLSPKLLDSGRYVCRVSNEFETAKGIVDLAVLPPGPTSLMVWDLGMRLAQWFISAPDSSNFQSPEFEGTRVLNISAEDLLEEWESTDTDGTSRGLMATVGAVLGIVLTVLIIAGCTIGYLAYRGAYRKQQLRNKKQPRKEVEQWKILSQDSRFQLISAQDSGSESEVEELMKEWQSSNTDCFTKGSLKELNDDLDFDHGNSDNLVTLESEHKIKPEKSTPVDSTPVDTRDSMESQRKLELVATNRKRKKNSKTAAKDPDSSKRREAKNSSCSNHAEKEDQASSQVNDNDSPLSGKVDKPKGESEVESD